MSKKVYVENIANEFGNNRNFTSFYKNEISQIRHLIESDKFDDKTLSIFIPPDSMFDMLKNASGLSFEELVKSGVYDDIMYNHLVYLKQDKIISLENNNEFLFNGQFLDDTKKFTVKKLKTIQLYINYMRESVPIDLYTINGILATPKQREYLVSLKLPNPFLDWLVEQSQKGFYGTYFIPTNDQLDNIYKQLDIDIRIYDVNVHLPRISKELKDAFLELWALSHNKRSAKFDSHSVEGIPFSYKGQKEIFKNKYLDIQYIEGFLTTPQLSLLLKRNIILEEAKILYDIQIGSPKVYGDIGNFVKPVANKHNPFRTPNQPKNQILPDITVLVQLDHELGIKSHQEFLEKTRFSNRNLVDFFSDFKLDRSGSVASWSDNFHLRIEGDPNLIDILEEEDYTIKGYRYITYYVSRLPIFMITKLRQIIANNSNARGDLGIVTADPLHLITEGKLKGKDLISLCVSNAQLNKLCNANNQKIFVKALHNEFNLTWEPNLYEYETPRELYKQMHTEFYLYRNRQNDVERVIDGIIRGSYWRNHNPVFESKLGSNETILAPSPIFVEYQKTHKNIDTTVVKIDKYIFAYIITNTKPLTYITNNAQQLKNILGDEFNKLIAKIERHRQWTHDLFFPLNEANITSIESFEGATTVFLGVFRNV